MQKVITITTHTNVIKGAADGDKATHIAIEYPEIKVLLEQGYKVSQIVPVVDGSTNSYRYSLTFLLVKADE